MSQNIKMSFISKFVVIKTSSHGCGRLIKTLVKFTDKSCFNKGTGHNKFIRRGPTLSREDTTYLMNITFKILLALKLAASNSKLEKIRFKSNCHLLMLDREVAMQ